MTYNSRSSCDGLIANIKKTGKREGITFGAKYDPCMSLFGKIQSVFKSSKDETKQPADTFSVAVTLSVNYPGLSPKGTKTSDTYERGSMQTLCNKTDNNQIQMLDPESLEPIGIALQSTLHPDLKGPASGTHAKSDPKTGDVFNYNLDFKKGTGFYQVFRSSVSTGKTDILASIWGDPAYLHSISLTEHYVVLCVWNSCFTYGGASVLWTKNIVDALAPYQKDRKCVWYIVDRKSTKEGGRGLVATYESDGFYCFHTVNSFEELGPNGEIDIVSDLIAYPNLDIIKRYYIDNLISDSPTAAEFAKDESWRPKMRRFRLPGIPQDKKKSSKRLQAVSGYSADWKITPELPTINPRKVLKKHRYVYGLVNTGKSTLFDDMVKYDLETSTAKVWSKPGHSAGEAIFIPNPEASEEDEDNGVLLSVVLDGFEGKSYLLVLDAKTMEEVGRAKVEGVVGFGFHGTHMQGQLVSGIEGGGLHF